MSGSAILHHTRRSDNLETYWQDTWEVTFRGQAQLKVGRELGTADSRTHREALAALKACGPEQPVPNASLDQLLHLTLPSHKTAVLEYDKSKREVFWDRNGCLAPRAFQSWVNRLLARAPVRGHRDH